MALINCPECGKENVSDSANSCPNCGYNIKEHFEKLNREIELKKAKEEREKREKEREASVDRFIDKLKTPINRFKSFTKIKMQRRSFGKIDDKQYVTNDPAVIETIREKQLRAPFRKGQKFIVKQRNLTLASDLDGIPHVVGSGMMLNIMNVTKPLMKIRIHSSKKIIFGSVSYHEPTTSIYVHPANILLPSELALHRFHNIVVVLGAEPITTREWYTFLKSGTNISVADF